LAICKIFLTDFQCCKRNTLLVLSLTQVNITSNLFFSNTIPLIKINNNFFYYVGVSMFPYVISDAIWLSNTTASFIRSNIERFTNPAETARRFELTARHARILIYVAYLVYYRVFKLQYYLHEISTFSDNNDRNFLDQLT